MCCHSKKQQLEFLLPESRYTGTDKNKYCQEREERVGERGRYVEIQREGGERDI